MKRILALLLVLSALLALAACSKTPAVTEDEGTTLVYGSGDYTRINPAMDEHGEINVLLFSGLTAHNGSNEVVAGLAESWEYDESACTYTFHLRDGVKWHDGEPFTAEDVKFTIEAIMDPENGSENAPNFEDVEEITVPDDKTVVFRLSAPNVAFLDYMTMAILPQHLLQGKDMQESDFFRHPVGTGPYKLESWDAGQSIVLVKNKDYYLGAPKIDRIIFKIVTDDNAQALQLKSGEIDLALLDPKNAKDFTDKEGYTCYDMTTADYRGILFNFWNDYWTENRDLIPAICYGIDRQAIIDSVLLGQAWPPTVPCSATFITILTFRTMTMTRKRQRPFWRTRAARWAKTASTSETARRSVLSSASWPVSRTASTLHRLPHSSCAISASTARSTFPHRWTGAGRWPASSAGAARSTPTTTPIRSSARTRAQTTPATPMPPWTAT